MLHSLDRRSTAGSNRVPRQGRKSGAVASTGARSQRPIEERGVESTTPTPVPSKYPAGRDLPPTGPTQLDGASCVPSTGCGRTARHSVRDRGIGGSTPSIPTLVLLAAVCWLSVLPVATAATTTWHTSSTMYCLKGGTPRGVAVSLANFHRLHHTEWKVIAGPAIVLGRTFIVADKGPKAHFDMWEPSCRTASAYGGHRIVVRQITTQVKAQSILNPPTSEKPVCYHIPEIDACPHQEVTHVTHAAHH